MYNIYIRYYSNTMLYILLPGYSPKNLAEMEEICESLERIGYKVHSHRWRHWKDPEVEWDEEEELSRIIDEIKEYNESSFGLIGKSVGTGVSLELFKSLRDKVKILILMGIPCGNFSDNKMEEFRFALQKISAPKFVIQNQNDPLGSSTSIRELLKDTDTKLTLKESDDHRYNYPEDILAIIKTSIDSRSLD